MWCKTVRCEGEMAVLWGVKARGTVMVGMLVVVGVGVDELAEGALGMLAMFLRSVGCVMYFRRGAGNTTCF